MKNLNAPSSEVKNTNTMLQEAIQKRSNNDFDGAIFIYQELIKLQPKNATLYDRLAQTQAQKGNFIDAIDNYRRAIDLGIKNPIWVYRNLGDALREENRLEEAKAAYIKAIKIDHTNPFVYDSLGQIQAQQEEYSEAIKNYKKALELEISNPTWTYENLKNALKADNRIEEADSIYQEMTEAKSRKAASSDSSPLKQNPVQKVEPEVDNKFLKFHNQGDEYFKQQRWSEAIAFYQQAIKLNSNYFWSYYNLGRALSQLEKWDKAILYYRKAIGVKDDVDCDIYECLGEALTKSSNTEKNIYITKNPTSKEPKDDQSKSSSPAKPDRKQAKKLFSQAEEKFDSGEYDVAESLYEQAIELANDQYMYHHRLGNALYKRNAFKEAVDCYTSALKLKPDYSWSYYHMGVALEKEEEYLKAIEAYQEALKLNSNFSRAVDGLDKLQSKINKAQKHFALAEQKAKTGNLKEAETLYRQAIAIDSKNYNYHFKLGDTLYTKGNLNLALKAYSDALKLKPKSAASINYRLGLVLQKQGKLQAALVKFQKVFEVEPNFSPLEENIDLSNLHQVDYTSNAVVYYPPFRTNQELNDHLARAAWYLSYIDFSAIYCPVLMDVEEFSLPEYLDPSIAEIYEKFKKQIIFIDANKYTDLFPIIDKTNIVLHWNLEDTFRNSLYSKIQEAKSRGEKQVWRVDCENERFAGSFYIKVGAENYPQYDEVVARNQDKFVQMFEKLGKQKVSYIFGSGPTINNYKEHNYDDGISIICNSLILDEELIDYVDPKILCFGDPIFHFGCSQYAANFRKYVEKIVAKRDIYIVIPMNYYRIFVSHYPHLEQITIGIPMLNSKPINMRLNLDFYIKSISNVLTMLLLPVGATFSDDVRMLGFDGRKAKDNSYFWKHSSKVQLVQDMDNIQISHPSFFKISYDSYYDDHINSLESWLEHGEGLGKTFSMLGNSYIPPLRRRFSTTENNRTLEADDSFYPLVSIVMPCCNNGLTVEESADSVLTQDYPNLELIIADEASDSETVKVLEKIAAKDTRVKVYHKDRKNAASARNHGAAKAKGEYIAFLDSDDIYFPNSLTLRMDALVNYEFDGVYCRTHLLDETMNSLEWTLGNANKCVSFMDMKNCPIHISSIIWKRSVLENISFFDDSDNLYAVEDWDLLQRATRSGAILWRVDDAFTGYRINPSGAVLKDYDGHSERLKQIWNLIYSQDHRCTDALPEYRDGLGMANNQFHQTARIIQSIVWLCLSEDSNITSERFNMSPLMFMWHYFNQKTFKNILKYTIMRYYRVTEKQWIEKLQENSDAIIHAFEKMIPNDYFGLLGLEPPASKIKKIVRS